MLVKTFVDLANIDEVYPHEDKVLAYVEKRLKASKTPYRRDKAGNIVATIKGSGSQAIGICGHVDIAAPLMGRKIVTTKDKIKTDGVALLGGDDKTAVAAMLELADWLNKTGTKPVKTVELIFTVGEEAGLDGAKQLDLEKLKTDQILIFDWYGAVNNIVTKSPAYYDVDVKYLGKDAHPAMWQTGINAGAVLMKAAAQLRQGGYSKDVIFNIGIVRIGEARNKVPGHASLTGELRSYNSEAIEQSAAEIAGHFEAAAKAAKVQATVDIGRNSNSFHLDKSGSLYKDVVEVLKVQGLKANLEPTYGCFDGSIFAGKGKEVMVMGAAYYNPHSPDEYVDIQEFLQMYQFIKSICLQ